MAKQYVCKIDNAVFNSEESLIQHLLDNYTMEQNEGDIFVEILKQMQDAFPEAIIEVKPSYEDPKIPEVKLFIKDCGAHFRFKIVNKIDEDNYYELAYESLEEAVDHYKNILEQKDILVTAIKNKYNAEKVVVHQLYESQPVGDTDDSIYFSFYINGEEYRGTYEFQGIDRYLKQLDGYFINSIEGECVVDYGRYESDNTIYVDEVDLRHIARRAKRLKVEITEFR